MMKNIKYYLFALAIIIALNIIFFLSKPVEQDKKIEIYDTTTYNNNIDSMQFIIDSLTNIDKAYTDTIIIKTKVHEKKADSIYNLPANEQIIIFTRYTDSVNQ